MINTPYGQDNYQAIESFASDLDLNPEEVRESFENGLRYNIKAAYKSGLIDEESQRDDLEAIIGAYTLNFRSALSKFKKDSDRGVIEKPRTILTIAKKMYLLPPDILNDLRQKYQDNPDVEDWMIKRLVVSNSSDPQAAIEAVLASVKKLQDKYQDNPDISNGMIRTFVIREANPEAAIEKALVLVAQLKKEYQDNPDVEDWMIHHFVTNNPKDPQAAIEKALQTMVELRKKFKDNPEVNGRLTRHFAVHNPDDAEAALARALETKQVVL